MIAPSHWRFAWLARVASILGASLAWVAAAIVFAWLIGRVLTDRYAWSQWLFWIPTPALLPVILFGIIASLRPTAKVGARRRRLLRWASCGIAIAIYFALFEHRLMHRAPPQPSAGSALHLAHWNAQPAVWSDVEPCVRALIEIDADVTVLTSPGGMLQHELAQEWIGKERQVVSLGVFTVISRVPIQRVRPLIAADRTFVVMMELDTTATLGRPIVMYLVDMPSNPPRGRAVMASNVRKMLDGLKAPPPDLVVGDFNIPRGSASLEMMFSNLREAYNEGGYGYGATFPRKWPWYHIDHVLLGPDFKALRYDIIDPQIGRHRAQVAWLVKNH